MTLMDVEEEEKPIRKDINKKRKRVYGAAVSDKITDNRAHAVEKESSKKKKKKKKKSEVSDDIINNTTRSDNHKGGGDDGKLGEINQVAAAAAQSSTTLPNDFLLIEDIQLGNTYEKIALLGKKVCVHYTCKIQGNQQLVSSNMGGKPLKFLLGLKEIMAGLDDGIVGMRVGGKRRITISPALWRKGEGDECKKIRSKASLVYEIHLLQVIG